MKRKPQLLATIALTLLVSGCARFSTQQGDKRVKETYSERTGKLIERETTFISTEAGSRTFFDSKSNLSNWEAKQTEATQGAKVGSLSQTTSGTNAVETLKALEAILIKLGL